MIGILQIYLNYLWILQLNAEIAEIEELREKDLPGVQELSLKIKELHHTVDELNKDQATLRTTIKQLKEKSKETDEKVWHLVWRVSLLSKLGFSDVEYSDPLHIFMRFCIIH